MRYFKTKNAKLLGYYFNINTNIQGDFQIWISVPLILCSFLSILSCVISITISFIIFWDFSMFYQIFLSPKLKRWPIIHYKHGIYELPHELPNNLRLSILWHRFLWHVQTPQSDSAVLSPPAKMGVLLILA